MVGSVSVKGFVFRRRRRPGDHLSLKIPLSVRHQQSSFASFEIQDHFLSQGRHVDIDQRGGRGEGRNAVGTKDLLPGIIRIMQHQWSGVFGLFIEFDHHAHLTFFQRPESHLETANAESARFVFRIEGIIIEHQTTALTVNRQNSRGTSRRIIPKNQGFSGMGGQGIGQHVAQGLAFPAVGESTGKAVYVCLLDGNRAALPVRADTVNGQRLRTQHRRTQKRHPEAKDEPIHGDCITNQPKYKHFR